MFSVTAPLNKNESFSPLDMKWSGTFFLLVGVFFGAVAAKTTPINVSKLSQRSANDGKIEVHQLCNSGAAKAEISLMKKEVETLRGDLTRRLDQIQQKGTSYGV